MPFGRRHLASLVLPALGLPLLAAACSSPDPVLYTIPMKPGPVLAAGPRVLDTTGTPGRISPVASCET